VSPWKREREKLCKYETSFCFSLNDTNSSLREEDIIKYFYGKERGRGKREEKYMN